MRECVHVGIDLSVCEPGKKQQLPLLAGMTILSLTDTFVSSKEQDEAAAASSCCSELIQFKTTASAE